MNKTCTKCGETKDLSCFNKRFLKDGTNAGTSRCKKCNYEVAQAWKKAHPERTKEQHKKSKLKNIERYRAYDREYKRKNRDKMLESERKWFKEAYSDGKHHVYILPEEHYCGITKYFNYRLKQHLKHNRIIEGAEIIMSFDKRRHGLKLENCFHRLGWYGGDSTFY